MARTRKKPRPAAAGGENHPPVGRQRAIDIDYKSIGSINHECVGCSEVSKCCCAKYDVCVSGAELKRIIPVLPEAAKLCPHLKTNEGYANVFEEAEKGQYAIDTHENGLCVFAFKTEGKIRCSLHAVEAKLGLPLGSVKPAVCILWPMTFSGNDVLTLHDDALSCACSSPRKKPSLEISPALRETIRHFGWEASKNPDRPAGL
jgi:hypothetical protein